MEKVLKFLIPAILTTIIFIVGTEGAASTASQTSSYDAISETAFQSCDSFTSDSNLYLPQQAVRANSFRSSNAIRRTNSAYKNHSKFNNTSKTAHTDTRTLIYKESVITYSSSIKPDHQLISLRKLLI